MLKRIVSAVLWFAVTGSAFNYLTLFMGIPPVTGLIAAGCVSLFVGVDPLHVFWPVSSPATAIDDIRRFSPPAVESTL
jgi:hypothetical protein